MRWLRPGINSRLTSDQLAGERIDFFAADALISLFPALPRVATSENLAVITAGKERFARRFIDDRADMLIGQHGVLSIPVAVALHKGKNAVHSTDEQPILCRLTDGYRLSSGR